MITNDVVDGIGRFLKKELPELNVYDRYTEQGFELPGAIIQATTVYAHRRMAQKHRLHSVLATLKIYGRNTREIRDMADTVLLKLVTLDTPDGPLLVHGQDCPYMNDTSATITFVVTVDMRIGPIKDEALMESLDMRERITHQ